MAWSASWIVGDVYNPIITICFIIVYSDLGHVRMLKSHAEMLLELTRVLYLLYRSASAVKLKRYSRLKIFSIESSLYIIGKAKQWYNQCNAMTKVQVKTPTTVVNLPTLHML